MKVKARYSLGFLLTAVMFVSFNSSVAFAQSQNYQAAVSEYRSAQIGQTLSVGSYQELIDEVRAVITSRQAALPSISIELGTVDLDSFRNYLSRNNISAEYFRFIEGLNLPGKDPWEVISPPEIVSPIERYRVVISKVGYMSVDAYFEVENSGENPSVRFARSSIVMMDATRITFTVDPSSSGIDPQEFGRSLAQTDSRLFLQMFSEADFQRLESCRRSPNQVSCGSTPTHTVRLFRR